MSLPLPMVTGYLAPQEISRMKREGEAPPHAKAGHVR